MAELSLDVDVDDAEEVDVVAAELNNRPRKDLGWQTPPSSSLSSSQQSIDPVLRRSLESARPDLDPLDYLRREDVTA
ncbi:hypothetical protein [Streptosporangium sp. NPDC051022]|uniref:hypothetical protein n=1 Tax=Streptosporangium sp. NPDC051022 TaxID=3155752 RepID=UPI00343C7BC2